MFGRKKERPISFFFSAKDGALHLYPDRLEKKGVGPLRPSPSVSWRGCVWRTGRSYPPGSR